MHDHHRTTRYMRTNIVVERTKMKPKPSCRFCGATLRHSFVDLGMSPLCESYVSPDQLNQMEPFYPLHVYVCGECFLVQLEDYVSAEHIFSEYAYFSSYSDSWVEHARRIRGKMIERFHLGAAATWSSWRAMTVTCCSISWPAASRLWASSRRRMSPRRPMRKGVPTLVEFFGASTARANGGARARRRICCSATTCWPRCPTSTISSRE